MVTRLYIGLCALLFTLQVQAVSLEEMRGQSPYGQAFTGLDTNGDAKLSRTEAGADRDLKAGFSQADKNKNGNLDQEEFSTYKSKVDTKENKQTATDSAITTNIKSQYLVEKNFSSFKVSVETKDQIVILSGFVDTAEQKARAGNIAKAVKGVKSVNNALVVKP